MGRHGRPRRAHIGRPVPWAPMTTSTDVGRGTGARFGRAISMCTTKQLRPLLILLMTGAAPAFAANDLPICLSEFGERVSIQNIPEDKGVVATIPSSSLGCQIQFNLPHPGTLDVGARDATDLTELDLGILPPTDNWPNDGLQQVDIDGKPKVYSLTAGTHRALIYSSGGKFGRRIELTFQSYVPFPKFPSITKSKRILTLLGNVNEGYSVLPFRVLSDSYILFSFKKCEVTDFDGNADKSLCSKEYRPEIDFRLIDSRQRELVPIEELYDKRNARTYYPMGYLLPAGDYAFWLRRGAMRFTRTNIGPWPRYRFIAQADELIALDRAPVSAVLNQWLTDAALSEHLKVMDVFSIQNTFSCATQYSRLNSRRLYEISRRQNIPTSSLTRFAGRIETTRDYCDRSKPIVIAPKGTTPNILVRMRTETDVYDWESIERDFLARTGESLWDKFARKVALALKVSTRRIAIDLKVACGGNDVYLQNGQLQRDESRCVAASVSSMVADTPSMSSPVSLTAVNLESHFGERVRQFFVKKYKQKNATLKFVEVNDDTVEVIVKGLKGEVLDGGRAWELIQIIVSKFRGTKEHSPYKLKVTADGRIASGIGRYPPESAFTTDMEPASAKSLNDFARATLVEIQRVMESENDRK